MARSRITDVTTELQSDTGSVLWSIVQGERLEFPIVLDFLENAANGYTFEAVIAEAANTGVIDEDAPDALPTTLQPAGVEHTLTVRIPTYKNAWNAATAYTREDFVSYNSLYYKRNNGTAIINAVAPDVSPDWTLHNPQEVYLQFVETLSSTFAIQPQPNIPVYGFFELSVTEPASVVFQRTWKPMRGMVEFLFSPTLVV